MKKPTIEYIAWTVLSVLAAAAIVWLVAGCAGLPLADGTVPHYVPGTTVDVYDTHPDGTVSTGLFGTGLSPWWLTMLLGLLNRPRQNIVGAAQALKAGDPLDAVKHLAALTPLFHTPPALAASASG